MDSFLFNSSNPLNVLIPSAKAEQIKINKNSSMALLLLNFFEQFIAFNLLALFIKISATYLKKYSEFLEMKNLEKELLKKVRLNI